jgi:hypothetical protein
MIQDRGSVWRVALVSMDVCSFLSLLKSVSLLQATILQVNEAR